MVKAETFRRPVEACCLSDPNSEVAAVVTSPRPILDVTRSMLLKTGLNPDPDGVIATCTDPLLDEASSDPTAADVEADPH